MEITAREIRRLKAIATRPFLLDSVNLHYAHGDNNPQKYGVESCSIGRSDSWLAFLASQDLADLEHFLDDEEEEGSR